MRTIGNVIRHTYDKVYARTLWNIHASGDLARLHEVVQQFIQRLEPMLEDDDTDRLGLSHESTLDDEIARVADGAFLEAEAFAKFLDILQHVHGAADHHAVGGWIELVNDEVGDRIFR